MREVTLPSRYHSVALIGFKSYLAFVDLLDHLDVHATIHHLFLSFPSHLRVAEQHLLYRLSEGFLLSSFRKILTVASPTLQTMFAPSFPNIKTAWPILPVLTDITIRSSSSLPQAQMNDHLPSLKRLHIWDGCIQWHRFPPFTPLTHMRLSNVPCSSDLPLFLRILLDVPVPTRWVGREDSTGTYAHYKPGSHEALNSVQHASSLPHLKSVFVRPSVHYHSQEGSAQTHSWCTMMQNGFTSVAHACARGKGTGKLYLLPSSAEYTNAEARADWLDVINGGDGAWSLKGPMTF